MRVRPAAREFSTVQCSTTLPHHMKRFLHHHNRCHLSQSSIWYSLRVVTLMKWRHAAVGLRADDSNALPDVSRIQIPSILTLEYSWWRCPSRWRCPTSDRCPQRGGEERIVKSALITAAESPIMIIIAAISSTQQYWWCNFSTYCIGPSVALRLIHIRMNWIQWGVTISFFIFATFGMHCS